MKSNNFWISKQSDKYSSFACSVPSDIPAYELCYHLLQPQGKRIIDFGCFEGESSRRILDRGASYVLGIDKGYEHVQVAKERYADPLHFIHLAVGGMIAPDDLFDGCMMTFVHQTINNSFELGDAFMKIEYILNQGSPLVMLGTHPDAPTSGNRFNFCRLTPKKTDQQPVPYQTELELVNGDTLKIRDYNWQNEVLTGLLDRIGFDVEVIPVKRGSLKPDLEAVLEKSIAEVESQIPGVEWKDEWKKPLYQIIVGRKRPKNSS